jgi:hypothetical protein
MSYSVLEVASEAGMKDYLREAMPQQILRQTLLTLDKPRWNSRGREGRCEVKMKTGIDSILAGNMGSTFRILHEHHRADR